MLLTRGDRCFPLADPTRPAGEACSELAAAGQVTGQARQGVTPGRRQAAPDDVAGGVGECWLPRGRLRARAYADFPRATWGCFFVCRLRRIDCRRVVLPVLMPRVVSFAAGCLLWGSVAAERVLRESLHAVDR